jgi:hypothetical protein
VQNQSGYQLKAGQKHTEGIQEPGVKRIAEFWLLAPDSYLAQMSRLKLIPINPFTKPVRTNAVDEND